MTAIDTLGAFVVLAIAFPALLLATLGALSLANRPAGEAIGGFLAVGAMIGSMASLVAAAVVFAGLGRDRVVVSFGYWFEVGHGAFALELFVDSVSLAVALLTTGICAVVAAFSNRYLRREKGFNRYFIHFSIFVTGMLLVVLAGTMEILFAGWELLGLSSAMLVAFFHDRPAPLRNALNVFVVYRVSDAAMLSAAILSHHWVGHGSLSAIFGPDSTPLTTGQATVIGTLLAIAAAGKCAQLPFSGWLPRAMEGPTPSSAIFYGALSVHAGAYLLLRAQPTLAAAPVAAVLVGLMGLSTAIYAALAGRVQTDIKSSLAFASLTQVSVILVEIAIGLTWLPLLHTAGHALLRLLQFLRSPSVLHDFHESRNATRGQRARTSVDVAHVTRMQLVVYRFALERGHLDALLDRLVVRPFVRACRGLDAIDRRWCDFLAGRRGS